MTEEQIKDDMEGGSKDAAAKGKIPELAGDDYDQLLEILIEPSRALSVEAGREVVLTKDGGVLHFTGSNRYGGAPISKEQAVWVGERLFGLDTIELGNADYSFKPVKPIAYDEAHHMETSQALSIIPVLYGSQPNLGVYYQSLGGKYPAPSELLKQMKLDEAKRVQEVAAEDMLRDILYVAEIMYEAGADGINLDTCASSGDAEFYGALMASEKIIEKTGLPVQVGMATEMIAGVHTELKYSGQRLAGMWPHQQGKMVEKSGASIFGPVVNTKVNKTLPWNLARALTFLKQVRKDVNIPIHANVGMGVCGVPMFDVPPIDAVTRVGKAIITMANVDGL